MFELLVEILHSDNRLTIEAYRQCDVFRHSQTGERKYSCEALRYPTHDACLTQIDMLNREWLAKKATDKVVKNWTTWRMECRQIDGPRVS